VSIDFPIAAATASRPAGYTVVSVDGGVIAARPVAGNAPNVRAGTPCVVGYVLDDTRVTTDAVVLSSGSGSVTVRLGAEQRRDERYERSMGVVLSVRGGLGLIDGVTDDISRGGLAVRLNVSLDPDRRVLASVRLADAPPIRAAARVVSCSSTGTGGSYVVRLEFTLISEEDDARLQALINLVSLAPDAAPTIEPSCADAPAEAVFSAADPPKDLLAPS